MEFATAPAMLLLLSLLVLVFCPPPSEASLMGAGGGILGGSSSSRRGGGRGGKPWDIPRRNYPQYFYRVAEEDEDRERMMERIRNEEEEDEDGKKPCVGLCYYNKLKALKNRQKGIISDLPDDSKDINPLQDNDGEDQLAEEIVFHELQTEKPCVGICQYYRQMGLEEPPLDD